MVEVTPNRGSVLTIGDVPALPNGMATVYLVATDPQYRSQTVATLDDDGVLRTLDGDHNVFGAHNCEVIEVYEP